jgi:hypothetical protein
VSAQAIAAHQHASFFRATTVVDRSTQWDRALSDWVAVVVSSVFLTSPPCPVRITITPTFKNDGVSDCAFVGNFEGQKLSEMNLKAKEYFLRASPNRPDNEGGIPVTYNGEPLQNRNPSSNCCSVETARMSKRFEGRTGNSDVSYVLHSLSGVA